MADLRVAASCTSIQLVEALQALAAQGLLDMLPHGGARLPAPPVEKLVEFTEIRPMLEPEATRDARPRGVPRRSRPRVVADGRHREATAPDEERRAAAAGVRA